MLILQKLIKKFLFLRKSTSPTSILNLNISSKVFPLADLLLKTIER